MDNKYIALLFLTTTLLGLIVNAFGDMLNDQVLTIINYIMLFSIIAFVIFGTYFMYQKLFGKKDRNKRY
ncbi:hypothetical protein FE326_05120 [Dolosigranulum pigrum]|uniref:hypothetical protein n=1 Tax=Dolosigranulum pigrum TaxID=29394 RepID=UPI000DC6004F|nr:hypothetical protein [Dolosigranulum pigrum]QTJ41583.1 hypothetical protein FE326_05120 [Dolosigranulum pigrum]RAN58183.1 hypothetical protein B8A40_04805 [Dolosigranulum pigrum]